MALRDPLTNLYNRRYFEHTIEKLISLAIRRKEKLCLLMLDIDKFKNINDTYGHDIGDEVLKKLADNLLELLRNSDVITRMGGEEFAIVFPNTPIEAGYQTADKIRKVIENLKIEVKKDILISFTVSIGITLFDENKDKDVHSLLKRADIALYEAKDSGRNKVVIFNEKK
ncbi:GGDEF domain-containing protein [Arcobacter peruensis]|uniref:GGDEF domain-containing protein n=1 Tax=Arcobacter peruensis TaxID=2320140 RepID=UPI001D19774B|nr:GGDEF domain-containing protein [Arcobacter peruensis]